MAYGDKTQTVPAKKDANAKPTWLAWRDSLTMPPMESPLLEEMLGGAPISEPEKAMVRKFAHDGYLVFKPNIPDFDTIAERMKKELKNRSDEHGRVSEGWYWNNDVRALACAPHILDVLSLLYQRPAFPFQTLNFEFGSEQSAHSDTIHFHSLPRHWMCGVWVALEDIHPDSGPLTVYPGSHKLPDYDMHDLGMRAHPDDYQAYEEFVKSLLKANGFEGLPLLPKKGEAVLWVANLFHGGTPIVDRKRTRHSQATHYYFPNCQYYFPMQSDLAGGKIMRREVIDLRNGQWVTHFHDGQPVELGDLTNVATYPRPLPPFVSEPRASKSSGKSSRK